MSRCLIWTILLVQTTLASAQTIDRPAPEIVQVLAPSGELQAALYTGTPTSVLSETDRRGVGYSLGQDLAEALGVPYHPHVFATNADVLAAIKTKTADVAFTNASPERAGDMDFTQPYIVIELGYLAGPKTRVSTLGDVDKPGVKVGVTAKSSSDGFLSTHLAAAMVVREATFEDGIRQLADGDVDVYATNKASLFEMSEKLPGSHVLEGNWGAERHGVAVPKGRQMALPFLKAFVASEIASGRIAAAIKTAGLRGALPASVDP